MKSVLFNDYADSTNAGSKSANLRHKRFRLFLKLLKPNNLSRILDVGGTESIWLGSGFERQVTLLNISFKSKNNSLFTYVTGDACNMNFADLEFDIIFSNSVIEHVGGFEKQLMFANEVRRVGRKYWIQTPYKHFPIEPHFLFPLFQYFPDSWKINIGKYWKYSHLKRNKEDILDELSRLRLINKQEITMLFPDSEIITEKYFIFWKSLIALKK